MNTAKLVEEATHQRHAAPMVKKALGIMIMKSDVREYNHGRLVERLR